MSDVAHFCVLCSGIAQNHHAKTDPSPAPTPYPVVEDQGLGSKPYPMLPSSLLGSRNRVAWQNKNTQNKNIILY
jgi:hypothetical protein